MKKEFLAKAKENLRAAELLFDNQLYNASVNRAYYAVFQAPITALANIGIEVERISHEVTQANFVMELIQKRKIYPSHLRSYLMDLQAVRNDADYRSKSISSKVAQRQLRKAKEFIETLVREIRK